MNLENYLFLEKFYLRKLPNNVKTKYHRTFSSIINTLVKIFEKSVIISYGGVKMSDLAFADFSEQVLSLSYEQTIILMEKCWNH